MAGAPSPVATARQLWPYSAFTAAYFAHAGFFGPFLPLWLKDMGLGILVISLLTSVQPVTRMFAPYLWGALSDRTGERVRLLRWGALVALAASAGLMWQGGVWWIGFVLLVMFAQTSGMMPMTEAAVAHVVSQGGGFDARRYGRIRLWGSLGFMAAVLVSGWWFDQAGMQSFPWVASLTLGAVVLGAWALPDAREAPHPHVAGAPSIGHVLRQPRVRWLFVSIFFHVLSHMGIYIFFSLYLDSLGYSKAVIGLLWAVSVTVEIGWFLTQGRWLPLLSLSAWLVLCAALMATRMAATAAAASVLWVLVLAQATHALTFAAHHSACMALLTHHFPGRLRGRGQALFSVFGYGISGVVGSLLGGMLSERFGLVSVFWVTAATSAVAGLCALQVWRLRHGTDLA